MFFQKKYIWSSVAGGVEENIEMYEKMALVCGIYHANGAAGFWYWFRISLDEKQILTMALA